jgi:hypothetical protein
MVQSKQNLDMNRTSRLGFTHNLNDARISHFYDTSLLNKKIDSQREMAHRKLIYNVIRVRFTT